MLLTNQTAEFLKQLYLKEVVVNQLDNVYVNGDSRKMIGGLINFVPL